MVFDLKDLGTLTKEFAGVIKVLLADEKIVTGNIKDSKEDRAPLLEFLTSTLSYLNTSTDKLIPIENRAQVFYGAVYLVLEHIRKTRWNSVAGEALSGLIADKSGALPSISQLAQFHKSANIFLTLTYVDHDSRKGLKEQHVLSSLSTDYLKNFLRIGYELENSSQQSLMTSTAQNKAVKSVIILEASEDPEVKSATEFTFLQSLPTASALNLGNWTSLQEAADKIIQEEIGHKHAGTLQKLSVGYPVRAGQLSMLQDLRMALLAIPEADKADKKLGFTADRKTAILTGTMLLIFKQIKIEIGKWKKSEVYDELNELLEPESISHQDQEALMTIASRFIRFMTIDSSGEDRAFREEHIFSKTLKFNLAETLKDFQSKIFEERIAALEKLMTPPKAEKSGSWVPSISLPSIKGLFGGSKPTAKSDEDEEKTASASSAVVGTL